MLGFHLELVAWFPSWEKEKHLSLFAGVLGIVELAAASCRQVFSRSVDLSCAFEDLCLVSFLSLKVVQLNFN